MQQRYYDPVAGRFLSVDPVVTNANTGRSFNRYEYAKSTPYKYTDPDGRDAWYKEPSPPPPTVLPAVTIVATRIVAPSVTLPSISPAIMRGSVGLGLLTYSKPLGAPSEMCGVLSCGMLSEAETDDASDGPPEAGRKKDKGKDDDDQKGGHTKGKRNSTKDKHEKGDQRRLRDQGGEKKDERMQY